MVFSEVVMDMVVVHTLALLSVFDHYSRMSKIGNQKRVVGLLLGSWSSTGVLDIASASSSLEEKREGSQGAGCRGCGRPVHYNVAHFLCCRISPCSWYRLVTLFCMISEPNTIG